ncbi:5115_t:CDS:10 [Ambispora leptoticha]|uniref:5115_t:CDS:1 n=1 Tax=Ambispora leptoticha TaxID=144679 RepID=A0A9N8WL93_9GLOM|nr:5115_t:CDS:10 [Ambispora leptoticha]
MVETVEAAVGHYNSHFLNNNDLNNVEEETDQEMTPRAFSTSPPPSSTATPLSFTSCNGFGMEPPQSYTRHVVGQVVSRETVTTIYGDPPQNYWHQHQRQPGQTCYVCRCSISVAAAPETLIHCSSNNCNIWAHQDCMLRYGLLHGINNHQTWFCVRCKSIEDVRRLPPIERVFEEPVSATTSPHRVVTATASSTPSSSHLQAFKGFSHSSLPPIITPTPPSTNCSAGNERRVNPLHLLLAASDQIESTDPLPSISSFPRHQEYIKQQQQQQQASYSSPIYSRENYHSYKYSGINNIQFYSPAPAVVPSTSEKSITRGNTNIYINNNNKGKKSMSHNNSNVDIMKKFEREYSAYDQERILKIRHLKRSRSRQSQVLGALNESLNKYLLEQSRVVTTYNTLHENNQRLNTALKKLKSALVALAKEKPVLRVLRKISRNDNLQEKDLDEERVVNLFMQIGPQYKLEYEDGMNMDDASSNSSYRTPDLSPTSSVSSSGSMENYPSYISCYKCERQLNDNFITCTQCRQHFHIHCFRASKESLTGSNMCAICSPSHLSSSTTKRKNAEQDAPSTPALRSGKKRQKVAKTRRQQAKTNVTSSGDAEENNHPTEEGVEENSYDNHSNVVESHDTRRDYDNLSINESFDNNASSPLSATPSSTISTDYGPDATRQPARFEGDMYTPRWVRGVGKSKEGLCPHCNPPRWLKTKISAYWYHLNYQHGISSITGRPFAAPLQERENKKSGMKEALCHNCNKWILNQSPRDKEVLVPEIYW